MCLVISEKEVSSSFLFRQTAAGMEAPSTYTAPSPCLLLGWGWVIHHLFIAGSGAGKEAHS